MPAGRSYRQIRLDMHSALTFANEILHILVESQTVAFAPKPHVGGIVLPAAFVRGTHSEQLPTVPSQQQLLLLAVQTGATRAQREAITGNVNKARVLPTA